METMLENILWAIFSLFGLIMWLTIFLKKRKYEKIKGVITFVKTTMISAGDSFSEGAHCQYEYEYEGKKYQCEDKFYESSAKSKVGDIIVMYVDRNNPSQVLMPANIRYEKIYFGIFVMGIVAMFVW